MKSFALFTDVSSNPQRKCGVGACLLLPASCLEYLPQEINRTEISAHLRFKRFADTSSTKLEVQTVLWALENYQSQCCGSDPGNLQVFTDSQCVTGLPGRRAGLEASQFLSRRSGQLLKNAPLYQAFFAAHDSLRFQLVKVAGHTRACSRNTVQQIFSCVDMEVRKALTSWLAESGV
ncbi:MAG: ribonuclease H [Deltaproteobacteria bacterium]|nr:ribonuclease H [Deltaproteobacteria bacterium]